MTPNDERSPEHSLSRVRERAGVRVRARALRQSQTDAEALLWSKLRDRQLLGLKFRRQRPIAGYFADFACVEIGLIVELDGGQHFAPDAQAHDSRRSVALAAQGFEVLRFWNHEVLQQTEAVLQQIANVAERRGAALTPTLSRQRERGQDKRLPAAATGPDNSLSRARERAGVRVSLPTPTPSTPLDGSSDRQESP